MKGLAYELMVASLWEPKRFLKVLWNLSFMHTYIWMDCCAKGMIGPNTSSWFMLKFTKEWKQTHQMSSHSLSKEVW